MSGSKSFTDALQRMQSLPAEGNSWCLHCRGGFRSEARYIVSEDVAYSKGVGWVTSLAGVMKFSKLTIAPTALRTTTELFSGAKTICKHSCLYFG